MPLFISYSRRDEERVKALCRGLEAATQDVWLDHELRGGDAWWSVILERIRGCSAFVFALSDHSLQGSKPCRAELQYAIDLRRPIVPVRVGPVASMRAMPLAGVQVVDYDPDDSTSGFAVLAAVQRAASRIPPLPQPLPPGPAIPFGYLMALGRKIDAGNLSLDEQLRIVSDLRQALEDEDEDEATVRQDIVRMLSELRGKPWTMVRADQEIQRILATVDAPAERAAGLDSEPHADTGPGREPPSGWYPDPSARHQWRWFDAGWTPWASDHGTTVHDPL